MTPSSTDSPTFRNALLPREVPAVSGYDIAGGTATHEAGSGDTLWDAVRLADGRTALIVLKASGGAVPASFYAGVGRILFRGLAGAHDSLEGLMAAVNRTLAAGLPEATDQILDCAALIPGPEGVTWSSAGSSPGGIIGRDGIFEPLPSQGPPMGVMEGFKYGVTRHPMSVGDSCVTLSHASSGLFKGTADLVAGMVGKPVADVVSTVHRAIRQSQGESSEVSVVFLRRA